MSNENQIAAARLAQLFGSELLRVDQSTLHKSMNTSNAVQIDPKNFLTPQAQSRESSKIREQQILEQLNREAMSAYPAPPEPVAPITSQPVVGTENAPTARLDEDLLKQINSNLDRIATAVEAFVQASNGTNKDIERVLQNTNILVAQRA